MDAWLKVHPEDRVGARRFLGGFVQQYQVTVDPNHLKAYDLSIADVTRAVRASNAEVGGRVLEFTGREYMVRGRGYARSGFAARARKFASRLRCRPGRQLQ